MNFHGPKNGKQEILTSFENSLTPKWKIKGVTTPLFTLIEGVNWEGLCCC